MLEFQKAKLPDDVLSLRGMDVDLFGDNAFDEAAWLNVEAYWILFYGRKAGCTAFISNTDFQEDIREDEQNVPEQGTVYILTTGLFPEYRGRGLGSSIKDWQIKYAKGRGFRRIVTNCRESGLAILHLNQKFGFKAVRTTPGYYSSPVEATVVMELLL